MHDRRRTYFAFQGLLTAVLLLLFLYHRQENWTARFAFLLAAMVGSLTFIRLIPLRILTLWWAQMALFIADAALAWITLHWTASDSDLYLIFVLILFGTALTRKLLPNLIVAAVMSILYLLSWWRPGDELPSSIEFWLRFIFLWVMTSVLAILSQDTSQAQRAQERQYQERLIQFESLATLGQISGEVAHRIKGPLTTILVNAEVLFHRYGKSEAARKELKQIQDEVNHCKEILKNLLDLGRIEEMDRETLDLRGPLRSALKSIGPQLRKQGLRLELGPLGSPLMVSGDQSLLHEALLALLQNAVEACRRGGAIRIEARMRREALWWLKSKNPGEYCELSIADDGAGIAPEDIENIFRPFFTTKGREGSGLGLSAALRILQKHNGFLEAKSDGPGQGACFTVRLPVLLAA